MEKLAYAGNIPVGLLSQLYEMNSMFDNGDEQKYIDSILTARISTFFFS